MDQLVGPPESRVRSRVPSPRRAEGSNRTAAGGLIVIEAALASLVSSIQDGGETASILAARIKSFSERPPMAWV